MNSKRLIDWKIICAVLWLIFTVALAAWWTRLGLQYIGPKSEMIISEGIVLIACLTLGGIALIYYILQEKKRYQEVHHFFACANHELKTYMASIRLRAEGLEQDLLLSEFAKDAQKIVRDTNRLELQLENSLIFAAPGKRQTFLEDIDLASFIQERGEHYPGMNIHLTGNATIKADQRMLDVIIKNIMQNTLIHAQAHDLYVEISAREVTFSSNGKAFHGDFAKLGQMFYRHDHESRSGIGLFLVSTLMTSLEGKVIFSLADQKQLQVTLMFSKATS